MANKIPPRGYRQEEHPLPHNFNNTFQLHLEDETKNSAYIPIFRTSELAINPETIEVNPSNAAFGEDPGPTIHNGSIVPRVNFRMSATLTKAAIETDKVRALLFNWMPVYTAFLSSLEAEDPRTAVQVEDILELQHDVTNKDTYPLNSSVNLSAASDWPISTKPYTEVFGDWGLSVDLQYEGVAFDKELFFDAMQYYGNAGMLKKSVGPMKTIMVTRDRPYRYHSSNFTNPTVKRGNPYTFCGVLVHLPQANAADQLMLASDTTNITHLDISFHVRFDEWNPNFDQAAY